MAPLDIRDGVSGGGSACRRSSADLPELMEALETNGDLMVYRHRQVGADDFGIVRALRPIIDA